MKISFLFLLTALSLSVAAQKSDKMHKGQLMTRGIGISFQSFDGLNSRIANLPQYKTLRDYMGIISLGSMNVHKNFVSGLTLTVGSSMSGDRDKKSSAWPSRLIFAGFCRAWLPSAGNQNPRLGQPA